MCVSQSMCMYWYVVKTYVHRDTHTHAPYILRKITHKHTQIPPVYMLTFSKSINRSKINSKINDLVCLKNAIKNKREIYFKLKMFNQMGCIDLT